MNSMSIDHRDTCISLSAEALFTITKKWNEFRCFQTDEKVQKMWHTHETKFYSAQKSKIMLLATK